MLARSALVLCLLAAGAWLAAPLLADDPPSNGATDGAPDYHQQKAEMVALIELEMLITGQQTGITELNPDVKTALYDVPRHAFVPEELRPYAYRHGPLPVGYDQNISSPFLIALMAQLAGLDKSKTVFETGTDAGYMAAVLSRLAASVYSVEVIEPLANEAARRLKELGYDKVEVKQGDGYYGWAEYAPYDAIVVKEAVDHIPPPLLAQLKPGGRLVIPLGPARGPQVLTLVQKNGEGRLRRTEILPVVFSPLQGGERT
ncbi:MAG: protein-L-isoaspartate(D-aspartate) O-methyltransferase [Kiloniellales bacterium]